MPKKKAERIYAPVDPVYRIPDVAINPDQLVHRALTRFEQFESDRTEWLQRREEYYLAWDDYISPIRKGPWDGSSNLHLPMTEVQINLMHARLMQAFFFIDPWFFVEPQEELDVNRIKKIELMLKYIVKRYSNYNEGIYSAIDDWCWDIVTEGMGIMDRDWHIVQRRFVDVERNTEFEQQKIDLQKMLDGTMDEEEFVAQAKDFVKQPYVEKSVIRNIFNGPIVRALNPIYVLFRGAAPDAMDLNQQETVIQVCYFTKDELLGFAEQEMFDEKVVHDIIENTQPTRRGYTNASTRGTRLEYVKDRIAGTRTVDSSAEYEEYEFYKVYDRVALAKENYNASSPGGGFPKRRANLTDELVYFVHPQTHQLARWTYLDRISSNGKRPLHMAHLYTRPRRTIGRGMVETQYPLNDTADLLINQSIDAGTLANNPMFGYRGNSTFDPQEVRVEPGIGLRMDDPNNDLRFFDWRVNPNWSANVQGLIQGFSQQLTSLGPLASGQVGSNVGPLRSNAGAQTLLGEMNVNLDVVINRAKKAYSAMLEGLYADCIDRMPETMKITVLGPDGDPEINEAGGPKMLEVSKEELRARVHFGLYANSQNMNKEVQKQAAMNWAQFLLQPVALQTGIVKPENIYSMFKNMGQLMGIPQVYKYITEPAKVALPLQVEVMMITQGIEPPVVINDPEHRQKAEKMQQIVQEADGEETQLEMQLGKLHPNAMELFEKVIQKHLDFAEVVEQPTNLQNPTGVNQPLGPGGQPGPGGPQVGPPPQPNEAEQILAGEAPEGGGAPTQPNI